MRDLDIREALHSQLLSKYRSDPTTRIIDEMGILTGDFRVDVAVINGQLEGFEIKSARDRLDRLPSQAEAYGRVFDRMTAVCSECHYRAVSSLVPKWWGIVVAEGANAGVRLVRKRVTHRNPNVDPFSVAQLLWRDEALQALENLGSAEGIRSKPRRVLWGTLSKTMSPMELCEVVRDQLRARASWRVDAQQTSNGG